MQEFSIGGSRKGKQNVRRAYKRWTAEDARRWAEKYGQRISILKISKEEGVDPGTVSAWLRKAGVKMRQGQHFVEQPPVRYSDGLLALAEAGPARVTEFLRERIWGIQFSRAGLVQLEKFCEFIRLHKRGLGVQEISQEFGVHRSTVADGEKGLINRT